MLDRIQRMEATHAFHTQRYDAKRRGIEFLLTFSEWVMWWESELGPDWLIKRGHQKGQFVMARFEDKGPYQLGNIKCIECGDNVSEAQKGKPHSEIHKQRIGRAHHGIRHTEQAKLKMRAARLGTKQTEEAKAKISKKTAGVLNPSAKLTEAEVIRIKELIKLGHRNIEIVALYKGRVSHGKVSSIRHGDSWAHIHV